MRQHVPHVPQVISFLLLLANAQVVSILTVKPVLMDLTPDAVHVHQLCMQMILYKTVPYALQKLVDLLVETEPMVFVMENQILNAHSVLMLTLGHAQVPIVPNLMAFGLIKLVVRVVVLRPPHRLFLMHVQNTCTLLLALGYGLSILTLLLLKQ
jgi:glyoxylate carboligase